MKGYVLAIAMLMNGPVAKATELAVIVNHSNFEALSDRDIKNIFLGRQTSYPNYQTPIDLAILDDPAFRNKFNDKALNTTSHELKRMWARLIFTGKIDPPKLLDTSSDVIEYVSKNENAIAVVPLDQVTNNVRIAYIYEE